MSDSKTTTNERRNIHSIVTIVWPSFHPILRANFTQATRLHALLEPRKRPSLCTRYRDMLTASSSVILFTITIHYKWHKEEQGANRNASSIIGRARLMLFVSLLIPLQGPNIVRNQGMTSCKRNSSSHSFHDSINLMSALRSLTFFLVEHHTVFDL